MAIINPDDALGIAARDQAERRRWGQFAQHGNIRALDANAMDPQWDGFLERMHQNGVTRMADPSVGATRGMFQPSQTMPRYERQTPQTTNGIGSPPPSVQALTRIRKR